ncbi:hypothetical protein J4407_00180 [Candidatus Pacearchaeota archaeon]|nr:hypothetical protein [Candidatus Pacearchaeota archaeon]
MEPIALDIETSGLDKVKCGIWQIGAIDLNNPKNYFLEEGRIDDEDVIEEDALKIIGKTNDYLRNPKKKSQKELINNFFVWMGKMPVRNLLCQNPQFDLTFIEMKAKKYGLKKTFQHRAFDLHSIAQVVYRVINGDFLFKEEKGTFRKESDMNLTNILNFCGLPDKRILLGNEGLIKEGEPHNALNDCKLAGECFYRVLNGKNLFPEFSQYEIPGVLRK